MANTPEVAAVPAMAKKAEKPPDVEEKKQDKDTWPKQVLCLDGVTREFASIEDWRKSVRERTATTNSGETANGEQRTQDRTRDNGQVPRV